MEESNVATAEPQIQTTEPVNIAALMAKGGAKISGENFYEQKAAPEPPAPVTQVETTATPVSKETELTNVQDQPSSTKEPASADNTTPKQEPVASKQEPQDWKEVLKQKPDTEVLKALGYDDKWIGFLETAKAGGDLSKYWENVNTDYSKMSPEDVMRRQLRNEYPEATDEEFEDLYRTEVTDAYKLDPDLYQESDIKRGKNLLSLKAQKYRKELIAQQQQYLLTKPETKLPPEIEQFRTAREQAKKNLEEYKNTLAEAPIVKQLLQTKKLTIGEGEEAFNYESKNPQNIFDVLVDGSKAAKKLQNDDGSPNWAKQVAIGAILDDDKTFFSSLADHYKSLGRREAILPLENPSTKQAVPSAGETKFTTPEEKMAKEGRIVEW